MTKSHDNSGSSEVASNLELLVTPKNSVPAKTNQQRTCLLVLGMHRSGTSMITRILNIAGAKLPNHLMGATGENKTGHWESNLLVEYHDRFLAKLESSWKDWHRLQKSQLSAKKNERFAEDIRNIILDEFDDAPLYVVKDPRICRFPKSFISAVESAGHKVKTLIPVRNPLEVCKSLEHRDGMTRIESALLWLRSILDAEFETRNQERCIFILSELMDNWKATINQISKELKIQWKYEINDFAPDVNQFIDPQLSHHSHTTEDLLLDPILRNWVSEAWRAILLLSRNKNSDAAFKSLDFIRNSLDSASPFFKHIQNSEKKLQHNLIEELNLLREEKSKLSTTLSAKIDSRNKIISQREDQQSEALLQLRSLKLENKDLHSKNHHHKTTLRNLKADLLTEKNQLENLKLKTTRLLKDYLNKHKDLLEKNIQKEQKTEHLESLINAERKKVKEHEKKSLDYYRIIDELKNSLSLAEDLSRHYEDSTSWKITAPIRKTKILFTHSKIYAYIRSFHLYYKRQSNRYRINRSSLYDHSYYQNKNIDLKDFSKRHLLDHYLQYGGNEGRPASPLFHSGLYLKSHPDVERSGMNPLIHYIKYGKKEGRSTPFADSDSDSDLNPLENAGITSSLPLIAKYLSPSATVPIELESPVSIIIPVYNGMIYLERLLESVHSNTNKKHEIIIIDDASQDPEIPKLIRKHCKRNPSIRAFKNKQNLGFVKTVNLAVAKTSNNFVILNSDTAVPLHWLERLMLPIISDPSIASTTPFSNSATIFSYPNFAEDNSLPEGVTLRELDGSFQHIIASKETQLEAPTGVGFCMGINRRVWETLGGFDEVLFKKGYGEENDWCQRSIKHHYKNILIPNLFVYHAHGASFSSEEKRKLIKANLLKLNSRWPNYGSSVEDFEARDPWRPLREAATLHLCCQKSPIIIFDHELGGGANSYRNNLIRTTLKNNQSVILVTYNTQSKNFRLQAKYNSLKVDLILSNIADLENLSPFINTGEIVYNNIVSWPSPLQSLNTITKLTESKKIRVKILFHDYFPICPSYTLINAKNQYCGIPTDNNICNRCLSRNNNSSLYHQDITSWRVEWRALLEKANKVVVFSKSSQKLVSKAFPSIANKIKIISHKPLTKFHPLLDSPHSNQINIGVVGNLNLAKGAKIVVNLASRLAKTHPEAKIIVLGNIDPKHFSPKENLTIHGSFSHSDLPSLIKSYGINVCLLPSIWPETFSYVTQEIMQLGLPLVCFSYGAPAERVEKYPNGIVLDNQNPDSVIETCQKILDQQNT